MEHGLSKTRLYSIYSGMKQRCYNPNNQHYQWYGGKGIAICDEWLGNNGLQNFFEWSLSHGYNENLTIDRIDSSKGYSPDNCQWVTSSSNSSKAHIGISENKICKTVSEQIKILCVKLNISVSELARRCGKSPQAFSQKMKRDDFTPLELKEIANAVNCNYETAFILPNGERVVD